MCHRLGIAVDLLIALLISKLKTSYRYDMGPSLLFLYNFPRNTLRVAEKTLTASHGWFKPGLLISPDPLLEKP